MPTRRKRRRRGENRELRAVTERIVERFVFGDGTKPYHDPFDGIPSAVAAEEWWTREYARRLWPVVRRAAWRYLAVDDLAAVVAPDAEFDPLGSGEEDGAPAAAYVFDGVPVAEAGVAAFDRWCESHPRLVEEIGPDPIAYYRARLVAREVYMRTREA